MSFWSWLSSLFGAHPTPPPVPGTPAQAERAIGIFTAPGAAVELQGVTEKGVTDAAGYFCWKHVPSSLGASHIFVMVEKFKLYSQHVDLTSGAAAVNQDIWVGAQRVPAPSATDILLPALVSLVPPFTPLTKLRSRGQFFELENGQRFTAAENSDFTLLAHWQRGEDIELILAQRAKEINCNMLRVWTRYQGWSISATEPSFMDIDYSRVPAFLDLCARHGLYVELVGYAGTRINPLDTSTTWPDDPNHWPQLVASAQGKTNVLLELGNEIDQPCNTLVHFTEYQRPAGILSSHGSNGAEAEPVKPYWDYATFHTNGAFEEQRKVGHNAMEIWSGPTLTNETSRFPDVGMWNEPTVDRQKQHAYDAAAGAALLCVGSCFHSIAGKVSRLFTGNEIDVAAAWVAGIKSVDLACQDGPYTHRIDLEGPNELRVYERPVGGHNGVVRIRK